MDKFYGVWKGKKPGIYTSWDECKLQVDGFPGAKYRKLKATSREAALIEFEKEGVSNSFVQASSSINPTITNISQKPVDRILTVDGAANGICCEYQAVWTTGEKQFSSKQYSGGTNNIAEFLGLVNAIKYLNEHNLPLKIYTDSVTAMAWVRNKSANTTARNTGKATDELDKLLIDAENYLKINSKLLEKVEILKWETKTWGEIPADYGRK